MRDLISPTSLFLLSAEQQQEPRPLPIDRKTAHRPGRARYAGTTLVELVVVVALLAVVFGAVMPLLSHIRRSWDTWENNSEAVQNGRVLIDHMHRTLTEAARITAVSNASQSNGYIEFVDNNSTTLRYQIGTGNYVEFGEVGSLALLAGPVSQLQFTCYDDSDLSTAITDVDTIRYVKVASTVTNAAAEGLNKVFTTSAYLRSNTLPATTSVIAKDTPYEFDTTTGKTPALVPIDSTHYLCAYEGVSSAGRAVVLTVDSSTWTVTKSTPVTFDAVMGQTPALAQIDSTHYLCTYEGSNSDGWAVILTVDTGTWAVSSSASFEYDTSTGTTPALTQIDSTHTLCAYTGQGSDGWAVVLTVVNRLAGHWKLDETSGTTAADSSGNGNHGTLTNMAGTEWTTGQVGGALEFDGTDDYIDGIGNCPTGDYTVLGWALDTGGSGWKVVYSADQEIWLGVDTGPFAILWLDAGSDSDGAGTAAGTWTQNAWHHVAATWDGSDIHIYIDGVDMPITIYGSPRNATATAGAIGRWSTGGENWYGSLDDVRLYTVALSASEIAALATVLDYREGIEAKAATDATSVTIAIPAGTSTGDLLISAVATDGDTDASLAPPGGEGWTEIDLNSASGEVTLGTWWKLAGASESSTHEFTWSGAEQAYAWMMRFTGHDASDPIDAFATNYATSSSPTSPSVTSTVDDALILRLGGFDHSDITLDTPGLSGHTAITMDASAGMGVAFEEFTEQKEGGNGTSVTLATPVATNTGDLLIAAVVTDGDTYPSLAPPAGQGWTEIYRNEYSDDVTLGVWWKLAGASEPSIHQFTWSGNQEAYAWMMRFTGHDPSAPIHDWDNHNYSSSSPNLDSVNTTVANCMILRIGGFDDDDINVDNTGLEDHTDITMDESSSGGGTCSGGAGYQMQATAGPTDFTDFNLTASEEFITLTVAIAPATGGSGSVSGGAGYVKQTSSGSSGTSTFALTATEEARMVTVAVAPDPSSGSGSNDLLISKETAYEFDTSRGRVPALAQVDGTHYLCAYTGFSDDGWATVLIVDTSTWNITKGTSFEFDTINGFAPALAQIDSTHYLCVYSGEGADGWAVVLTVNTGTWTVSAGTAHEFDTDQGETPALTQIDSTHYLCAYTGDGDDGWAVILTVNTTSWTVTSNAAFEYDTVQGKTPALVQIDSSHHLCAYDGSGDDGWTVVLLPTIQPVLP